MRDFRVLVAAHQDRTFAVAFRVLRDREAALDILQESLLALFRNRAAVPDEQAGAWLARVAANRAIDQLRRRARERALQAPVEAVAGDPEAGLIADEERCAVAVALDQISPQQQAVVTRRVYEEQSFAAIARELGLAEGSVKVHFRRGLEALRGMLRPGRERTPS